MMYDPLVEEIEMVVKNDCISPPQTLLEEPIVEDDLIQKLNDMQEKWIRFHDKSKKKILVIATQKVYFFN